MLTKLENISQSASVDISQHTYVCSSHCTCLSAIMPYNQNEMSYDDLRRQQLPVLFTVNDKTVQNEPYQ